MEAVSTNTLVWAGILFCVSQSAMFSGLNLALLGISRLRIEVEATAGNSAAVKILALRKDVNFSRHAMRMGLLLAPVLRFYQLLLYPVAKPSALLLDRWLGEENISYFRMRACTILL